MVELLRGDAAAAAIAGRRSGLVTRDELVAAGLGREAIQWRLATGRLHRLHRGVYLVGHPVPPPFAREHGAVLACGDGALVSHRTAAAEIWELIATRPGPVDVLVPGRARASRDGIRVHRSKPLLPRDRARCHGVPVTAPARTLLDLAEAATARELERAWDEAHVRGLVRPRQIRDVLDRAAGRRGVAAIVALLERDAGPALTKLEAEERMLALVRAANLPAPEVNARVGPYEVDLLWRAQRLVIEIDSWRYHSKRKFESDRERDDYLQAHGFRVMRVTWRWIVHRREALIARVAAALAAASAR